MDLLWLCTLRITRLRVCGALGETGGGAASGAGAGAVILAARMHSSKRTLRSNDITVPPLDVELDLCFSLQYPHFVKRDGNRLQIMLQRRKKYKNRTILGYKTLAEGVIRMDQVLQRSMDMELELTGVGGKVGAAAGQPVAKLTITGLASTPVDHDTKNNNTLLITERGYSDEEEEGEFSSVEEADEMTYGAPARRRAHRQLAFNKTDLSYTKALHCTQLSRSRDLSFMERERKRQSYINSKANDRDRDSDSELETAAAKRKGSRGKLAELESLSCGEGEDSGPDQMDTISIGSTPKPSLRPFFSSSRSLANQEHHRHSNESEAVRSSAGDERASDGNSDGDATIDAPVSGASVSSSPPNEIKVREDKRSRLFRSATSGGNLIPGGGVTRKKNSLVVGTERPLSAHELPAQSPTTLEVSRLAGEELAGECVGVCGAGAGAAQAALLLAARPSVIARHLAASDGGYASLFTGDSWANICERAADGSAPDVAEMSSRIGRYLNSIGPVNNMPIGEAMVAYREKSGDEDASQTFVPFIAEVRVGCSEGGVSSLELEEGGSPPARASPPATPAPHPHLAPHMTELTTTPLPLPLLARTEPLELQLDYWLV
ncbi:hypothetical protein HF086_017349 [Spodoptera exigua]|uniref:Phosphofurin acidic cluster sorting protein 1 n=1 Tax=Spodoptera exigua TaxID=7107 RepID=A0A922M0T4_SPOEX|nr:hypothetical protein HF086_017349 [Spodoptera exigua]